MKRTFNINRTAMVVLTKDGAKTATDFTGVNYVEGSIFEGELWYIMRIFGNKLFQGEPALFLNNEIIINDKD